MDMFIGTILPWPIGFAPDGWLFCQGQTLQITQYQALFSLISNQYGGDGRTTFALPDLRARVPLGVGAGASGTNYALAQKGGNETLALKASGTLAGNLTGSATGSATLTMANMPVHNHAMGGIPASSGTADTLKPAATVVPAAALVPQKGTAPSASVNSYSSAASDVVLKAGGITGDAGQATPTPISVSVPLNTPVSLPASLPVVNNSGTAPPSNLQPYLVLNYIICNNGVYPTRP